MTCKTADRGDKKHVFIQQISAQGIAASYIMEEQIMEISRKNFLVPPRSNGLSRLIAVITAMPLPSPGYFIIISC